MASNSGPGGNAPCGRIPAGQAAFKEAGKELVLDWKGEPGWVIDSNGEIGDYLRVPSDGTYYSGGVENFPRLLENWSGQKFGAKLADTVQVENKTSGLQEFQPEGIAKTKAATAKAANCIRARTPPFSAPPRPGGKLAIENEAPIAIFSSKLRRTCNN